MLKTDSKATVAELIKEALLLLIDIAFSKVVLVSE